MPTYPVTPEMQEIFERNFTDHVPFGDQTARFEQIRIQAKALAEIIARNSPTCREQSLALDALEQVMFCAIAAIARHEVPPSN